MIFPAFYETEYSDCAEGRGKRVLTLAADAARFLSYCALLEQQGYEKKEERERFAAYQKGEEGVFLNFYPATGELTVLTEENCRYFDFCDTAEEPTLTPQISQVHLEDFGMSYAVRLSDGRFIILDGGRDFAPDADELYRVLKEGSPHERPVIAAWIMTHPHSDHIYCLFPFMERHGGNVVIEKFLYNFPDETVYRELGEQLAKTERMEEFYTLIRSIGAPVYTPHTGQTYRIGDAKCEILASMDDTVHRSHKINPTSLVIRMKLGGQVILWATDAAFSYARLAERYGDYLKSDILQVPHHGFGVGTAEAQIRCFDLISPRVCLLPVWSYNAYTVFCAHFAGTKHLMTNVGVEEMIVGDETRTLSLPYTPKPYGKAELARLYHEGQAASGAKVWFFTELSTQNAEDFVYTLLNTTHFTATLAIELFFEDKKRAVRHIKVQLPPMGLRTLSVIDPEAVDSEHLFYNPWSLQTRGIPENAPFALRIISDIPVVVTHKRHKDAYHA